MKKFTFKGVLDGFRSSVSQQVKPDQEIAENLRSDHFQVKKTFRHGFPFTPTAIAFDPIQHLLAIGSITGSLRILGRPGVDVHVKHEGGSAVIQLQFLINEGALISATADDTVHLWNFRQKIPQVVQSLKFQRERITCMHLPLQSKWLYVGTERGNIHILHIESFVLSGYVVNWNKAIEVSRKTHPGAVVHLSDNPLDPSKMLIGYESGQIVLWDLRTKNADYRCQTDEPLHSISWHHEGKQFICSHTDGSLSTWGLRQLKPIIVTHPHAKTTEDGELEACKPIHKVEWKLSKSGEAYIIFSGGLAYDTTGRTPSITVIQGKTTTVLEMEHNVVDFITLCESPWTSDFQEPYAVVVLLHNDLVVIDLLTAGFPCFENPYPMDIHESPVTCCAYFADCPSDLVPAFYSVGSKSQKRTGFSEREWPICGGEWSPTSSSYNEIIITGHADGSLKFWDASAGSLQVLYKLKTAKLFEKIKAGSLDAEDDPLAIQLMYLCPESRKLAIAGSSRHVVLFKFKKVEAFTKVSTLEIPIISETAKASQCSPDYEYAPRDNLRGETGDDSRNISSDYNFPLKVKGGMQKRAPGFQPTIVCLTPWNNGEQPENITALSLNSSCGLMAYGNESGLVIVDILQNVALLIMSTPDLYSSTDLYQRTLRSPKRHEERRDVDDKARSPSIDQINGVCVSPTAGKVMQELGRSDGSDSGDCSCLGSSGSAGGDGDACGNSNINGSGSGSMPLRRPAHEPIRHSRSQDKLESSFTRSRSSSMSSLENITMETISCLAFADSYTKKNDSSACPTLWIGTSEGAVLTVVFNAFSCGEQRHTQPVIVSTNSGSMFKLEGCVLTMSFLDCNGGMIPYSYESWKDDYLEGKDRNKSQTKSGSSRNPTTPNAHPTTGDGFEDRQFVVITSEKQARVVALPSQNCVYRQQLADTNIVVKAEITSLNDSVCLACYTSSGHIATYSLPSLRLLIDVDFLPLIDLRIARTLCFSNKGHGLYLSSPTEIQKFTVSNEFCSELTEMMGDIFIGQDMPEPPKESFFKGLFGGGPRGLDREELFGESSGRASRTVAKHIPGPYGNTEGFRERISSATGDVSHAHQMVIERGDKLSQLEERTARMMLEAENFSQSAHGLMLKYKDKKWYQL